MARSREPQARSRAEKVKADHWHASRLPVPDAQEGGESAWEFWQEESRRLDLAFAPTEPSHLAEIADDPIAHEPPAARTHLLNAHALMVVARRNNRVCPRPAQWSELYQLLDGERYSDLQAPPVQPWLWGQLSGLQKRLRFRDHVEWAERHGRLGQVAHFIGGLPEAGWVHMGEGEPS
jgi:hypothetical protein